jgi:hypothetical protein
MSFYDVVAVRFFAKWSGAIEFGSKCQLCRCNRIGQTHSGIVTSHDASGRLAKVATGSVGESCLTLHNSTAIRY